jgi:hypothetical protein
MAAAIGAARAGAEVTLLEARPRVGGTVAQVLIHTLGGLYDSAGSLINEGLPTELERRLTDVGAAVGKRKIGRAWVLDVCPPAYQALTERWLAAEPFVSVCTGACVGQVRTVAGRVEAVEVCRPQASVWLDTDAVVDATGTAELVRQVDMALLQSDPRRAAGGLICRVRGVDPAVRDFPGNLPIAWALHRAAHDGTLPSTCTQTWIDRGIHEDEVFVKLMVPLPTERLLSNGRAVDGEVTRAAHAVKDAVLAFLRGLAPFANARLTATGEIGIRDGGRVDGEYYLTAEDVRGCRTFADAVCRAAWPIEYWDPDSGVKLEYLPAGRWYEIPLRALRAKGWENLWVAGKCLSADRLAQASARVVGTCWAMGEAAGRAAAQGPAAATKPAP